LFGGIGGPDDL
jgi:hypothetical protein